MFSVLKYVQHSRSMGKLIITLKYAGPELLRFFFLFFLINVTFTVMGMLMFGKVLREFSSMWYPLRVVISMAIGIMI